LKNDFAGIVSITETIPKLLSSLNRKSYDNKDAWTSYRIGEAMQNTGRTQSSVQWFKNAYILAPLYPDFGNKYANALAGQKNFAEARKIFSSLVKEHPYYAPAFSNLGYLILIQEGNVNRANSYLDKALALDPDYELAILNKAAAFMSEGKVQDARKYLQKVLQINPENRQAIEGLKRITK
jgi:Tfp pilus assembly protein PilF